jgi:hypothetical protein
MEKTTLFLNWLWLVLKQQNIKGNFEWNWNLKLYIMCQHMGNSYLYVYIYTKKQC